METSVPARELTIEKQGNTYQKKKKKNLNSKGIIGYNYWIQFIMLQVETILMKKVLMLRIII